MGVVGRGGGEGVAAAAAARSAVAVQALAASRAAAAAAADGGAEKENGGGKAAAVGAGAFWELVGEALEMKEVALSALQALSMVALRWEYHTLVFAPTTMG